MREESLKVLLLDNNTVFVMYFSILLTRMGVDKVIPAETGTEALKLINILTPGLIVISDAATDMDSLELARKIRKNKYSASVPIVVISRRDDFDFEEFRKAGCHGYLKKPVDILKLQEVLHKFSNYPHGWKRKHLRAQFPKKVSLTFNGETSEHYAVTLSEGGIYIRTKTQLPIGSPVETAIPIDDNNTLYLKGKVIYSKGLFGEVFNIPPGIAIKFINHTDDEKNLLFSHIKDILTKDIIEESGDAVVEH